METKTERWIEFNDSGNSAAIRLCIMTEWKPCELCAETTMTWIGVDLGTTHSSAAYAKKGLSNRVIGVHMDMIPINCE